MSEPLADKDVVAQWVFARGLDRPFVPQMPHQLHLGCAGEWLFWEATR